MYREAQRVRRGGVSVLASAGEPGPPRVGVVAGKRVGGAVARNRAKRRLRAALRDANPPGGMDYIVIADREVVDVAFPRLVEWLTACFAALAGEEEEDT